MSDPQFKVGDVVRLKSGGPKMTVTGYGPGLSGVVLVACTWFDGAKAWHDKFPVEAVELDQE
jgi:uncharacterized protein YodC (DUF2158 family)